MRWVDAFAMAAALLLLSFLFLQFQTARANRGPQILPDRSDDASILVGSLSARERFMRDASKRNFPSDRWSADDDFHSQEMFWVHGEAQRSHRSVAQVYRAIDTDLRRNYPNPNRFVGAAPCKPRPFYD